MNDILTTPVIRSTLVRMTKLLVAALVGLVAGLSAAPEAPSHGTADRVAVVVDASGPGAKARLAAAEAVAAEHSASFRAPRTLRDQLSVTALLAAQGYTTVIGYGLVASASIAPLQGRLHYIAAG